MMRKIFLLLVFTLFIVLGCAHSQKEEPAPSLDSPNKEVERLSLPPKGVPVLMYHSMGDEKGNDAVITPKQLKDELAYLDAHNYHTITLDQLYQYLTAKKPLPENPVMLTFDDGYADNFTYVMPLVEKYKMHAGLFMITGKGDDGGYYLNWQQLKEMSQKGFEINPHTVSHPRLAALSRDKQKAEIIDSREAIEKKLNLKADYFCYPSGSYNAATLALLKEAGFKLAFLMQPDIKKDVFVKPGDKLYELPRIFIGPNTTLSQFAEKVKQ